MNSDNIQQRLTFGLAVFVCRIGRSKERSLVSLDSCYRVKRGCDLLILLLIHNISKPKKSRLNRRPKGSSRGFETIAPIIRTNPRAVKSTLAMLVIGDNIASQ
ncbi:hypothetical protein [Pseudomonas frederiksbergensis]|uniref:hypothetical protein n=1 Tax=Pseudomonas frederiksbergensis TaxID=104087 RepID=UPI003D1BF5B7